MTVARWGPDSITTTGGVPIPNLPITINVHGGGLATLYTDESGLTTAANPTTTDAEGNLQFFAATGDYDIVGNGATITVTLGGSGGGSITLIESLDSSVTVTNGAGPTVNLSVPPGGVTSVTAADSTLTITPTTGAVTAKIPSSVALPGSPTTTTQSALDSSTKVATTAYADSAVGVETTRATTAENLKLAKASNLSDVGSASTSLTNIGGMNRFVPLSAPVTATTHTLAANELATFDTTSNAITATLPNAPIDGTVVGLKLVAPSPAVNTVTYNCAGSDHFNITTGATTGTLVYTNQAAFYQYKASTAVWFNIGDDIPLSQLDLRYLKLTGGTMSGAIAMGSNKITGVASATTSGDALPYGETAGGDLSGTLPNPTVAKINNSPLGTTTGASTGNLLAWNGSAWAPATPPASVPPLSAMDAWGHSYLSGGTAFPTAQEIGLMSRLLGAFHVAETNFTPMVAGGATVLVPYGPSQAGWDAVFQKRLPPMTSGLIASSAGVTFQPALQWPLTNGPLFIGLNGFNDFNFDFQPYGVFNAFNFGVPAALPGATQGYSNGYVYTAGTNATTSGTYLPNRVGGAGVQVGDYLSATGIRGNAKVSAVTYNSLASTTITAATNVSTTVTCTAAGTYTIGEIVYISGALGGTWNTALSGVYTVTTGGTGSFQVVTSVAPTGSYTASSGSVQGGTFITIPSAQVTGSPTAFNTVPVRSTTGQAVTGLQNAFQGVIERAISGAVVLSTDSPFAYGGSTNAWATVSDLNANTYVGYVGGTGASQKITSANADTFTFTIDKKFPGGVIAIVFTGPVTTDLDNSGATVSWTGTSAANGTTATQVSGQGWVGQPVPVVQRFVLTGADAGKTIIGTFNTGTATSFSVSGCVLNSTTTVTGAFAPNITPGMGVSGTDIAAGTYVQSINSTQTSLTLSTAATGSTTTTLTFTSTVLQVDHASYEATYMSGPVLLANQPVNGPGAIFSPTAANILDKAINQAVSTFTGTTPQTVCGVTNNYSTIGKVDVYGAMNKRSFWLGTSLTSGSGLTVTYQSSSRTDTSISLIGQRTVSQGDQVAPFVGQYIAVPNAIDGDVNEICLITAVSSTSNATITGGSPAAGTYPQWLVSLARGLPIFGGSVYVSGNTSTCIAATGSTSAPTQGVYDLSWTQPLDMVHPGVAGSGLFASQFLQAYQAIANQTPDWVGTSNQSWGFGRTRSVPIPINNGWWSHDGTFGAGTSNAIGSTVFCQRFVTPVPIIVDQIGIDVTTAASTTKFCAGFFLPANNGSFPSTTVLFDFGLNNVPMTNLGMTYCTGWQLVPPGEYWVAVAFGNQGAGRCESMTAVTDDFPMWRTSVPTAGNHHLGWQGSSQFSSGTVTTLVPNGGWTTESTSFIPWIIVHAYQHTYLVGS